MTRMSKFLSLLSAPVDKRSERSCLREVVSVALQEAATVCKGGTTTTSKKR